jgi:lipopolysaccharide/colanic/teichoic acid biosynthesis glycosyltransferase
MQQQVLGQAVAGKTVEREQIDLHVVRRLDPLALSPLVKDRAVYYSFKRALDVSVATLVLVTLSPVMAVIALAIILDSGRPVIFTQNRVGARRWTRAGYSYWQRTPFTCRKFRSMVQDADPAMHQAFTKAFIHNDQQNMAALQGDDIKVRKLISDPRVTRLGRILRRSSLDELPQLWNVLKGDMSLVGPRPSIAYEVDEYKPWHRRRLGTKPGLTGLWQVTARSSADFDEMVRLDIQYIENQSFWLDLKILLRTPLVVFSGKGAV